jgi:hypothetical protein
MFKLKCVVDKVGETNQVTAGFKKRELWVSIPENDEWTKFASFETAQDKCSLLDALSVGDDITIEFGIGSKKYAKAGAPERLFNSLRVISIDLTTKAGKTVTVTPEVAPEGGKLLPGDDGAPDNDLPF